MVATDEFGLPAAAAAFAALGSEQRLGVLRALVRAGPEGLSVGTLGQRSGVSGSTLSHHLRCLAEAGLVIRERRGRTVICVAVAYPMIDRLSEYLLRHCCADADAGAGAKGHRHRHHAGPVGSDGGREGGA